VARSAPADRLDDLAAAALQVFCAQGFERTQMADVARVLGVAPGTLYRYVESKEALFHLVVDRALREGPAPAPKSLPLPTPPPGAIEKRLRERLAEAMRFPLLEQALERRRVSDPRGELEGIVREIYECVAATRLGATLVERSAHERPELAKLWYEEARHGFFERLTTYVARRIERGHFRPVPDAAVAARLVVETITWLARHRHGDPEADFDDAVAEGTVVQFVLSTFTPEETPA
jgi:AcrR family transcriptional regulator